jgi:hypothetical protein
MSCEPLRVTEKADSGRRLVIQSNPAPVTVRYVLARFVFTMARAPTGIDVLTTDFAVPAVLIVRVDARIIGNRKIAHCFSFRIKFSRHFSEWNVFASLVNTFSVASALLVGFVTNIHPFGSITPYALGAMFSFIPHPSQTKNSVLISILSYLSCQNRIQFIVFSTLPQVLNFPLGTGETL